MSQYPNRFFQWSIVSLLYGIGFFVRISPATLQFTLKEEFLLDFGQIGLLSFLFYFFYAIFQVIGSILSFRFHLDRIFVLWNILFLMGFFIFNNANSLHGLYLGRCLMGLGSSLNFLYGMVLTHQFFDKKQVPFYSAILNMIGILGAIVSQTPLEMSIQYFSWRFIMSLIWIGNTVLFLFYLRKKPKALHQDEKLSLNKALSHFLKELQSVAGMSILAQLIMIPSITLPQLWGPLYLEKVSCYSGNQAGLILSLFLLGGAIGGVTLSQFLKMNDSIWSKIKICLALQSISLLLFLYPAQKAILLSLGAFFSGFFGSSMLIFFSMIATTSSHPVLGLAAFNMLITIGTACAQPFFGVLLDTLKPWIGLKFALLCVFSSLPVTLLVAIPYLPAKKEVV